MSQTVRRFILYQLPVILYAGLIIVVSSIPRLPEPEIGLPGIDKIAHTIEYAILALLLLRAFSRPGSPKISTLKLLIAILICVSFASFDEYYQSHIPGRDSDLWDLVADSFGIIAGSLLHYLHISKSSSKSTVSD